MSDSVFVNKRSAVHKGSAGKATAFPCVNLCPPTPPAGPIPTPLPNLIQAADLQGGATSVSIDGNPMAKQSSFIGRSTGNAVARPTGGGVVSHMVEGMAYFTSYSMDVTVEGEPVPRHLDMMTHNHLAQSPPNSGPGTYLAMMDPGAPIPPVKGKDPNKRKDEPQTVEIFFDAPGGKPPKGATSLLLVSENGKYRKKLPISQATPKAGMMCLRFPDVLPGTVYSLFTIVGDHEVPFFEKVPFADIAGHAAREVKRSRPKRRTTKAPAPDKHDDDTKLPEGHDEAWYDADPWRSRP
jgi:hypothetical protein